MLSAYGCKPDLEGLGVPRRLHGKTIFLNREEGREGWFWWALIRSGAVLSLLTCVSPKVSITPPSLAPFLHQFVFQHVGKELMFEDVSLWISSRIRSDV